VSKLTEAAQRVIDLAVKGDERCLTAIFAKLGVEGVPSTLATAVRTLVGVAFAWVMVLVAHDHRWRPASVS